MCKTNNVVYSVDEKMLDEYCSRLVDGKICVTDNLELIKTIDAFIEGNAYLSRVQIDKREVNSDGKKYFYYLPLSQKKKVMVAHNLSDFLKIILNKSSTPSMKQLYRGHGNWLFDMIPGIYRKQNTNILMHESQYIHEMIASYPNYFSECKTALDYLVVLQHYSFPTRLLDFTENPLVALYMACDSEKNEFADVIQIDVEMPNFKYYDSDSVSLLANMAFVDDNFDVSDFSFIDYYHAFEEEKLERLRNARYNELISQFNMRDDIVRLLYLVRREKPYFSARIEPMHLDGTVLWVKAKQDFQRIINQSGVFAIFGINRKKQSMVDFKNQRYNMMHILIPPEAKQRILYELDKIHINQATLYCDMDRIASFHADKYRKGEDKNV